MRGARVDGTVGRKIQGWSAGPTGSWSGRRERCAQAARHRFAEPRGGRLLPDDTWEYFCLDNVRYRGRDLTIGWDKTAETYGKGLVVLVDWQQIPHADTLKMTTGVLASR